MPGGVGFEHVLAFQIKCMMQGQYPNLVEGIKKGSSNEVIAACLRLGWNDAFRHTSENTAAHNKLSDVKKAEALDKICTAIVSEFIEYATKTTTSDRQAYISSILAPSSAFVATIGTAKMTTGSKKLCFGHIQKMFNIAIKLLLCLLLSAEYATKHGLAVRLDKIQGPGVFLNSHCLLDFTKHPFSTFDWDTPDCPIDSYILKEIDNQKTGASGTPSPASHSNYRDIVWSRLGDTEPIGNYENAQDAIRGIQSGTGKSNLCFDFENWNS